MKTLVWWGHPTSDLPTLRLGLGATANLQPFHEDRAHEAREGHALVLAFGLPAALSLVANHPDLAQRVVACVPDPTAEDWQQALRSGLRDLVPWPPTEQDILRLEASVQNAPSQSPGHLVAFFSTKGGVGKSTLAANVAVALAEADGEAACLLDLDLQFGHLAALFGQRPRQGLVELCRLPGPMTPDALRERLTLTEWGPVHLLSGPDSPELASVVDGEGRRDANRNYVAELLDICRRQYPFTVIDTGVDFGDGVVTALAAADQVVLVSTPDIPALHNTAKGLDILIHRLDIPQERILIALNRANSALGLTDEDIAAALHFPVRFHLPSEGDVAIRAANAGVPLVKRRGGGALGRSLRRMAEELQRTHRPPQGRRPLWRV